MEGDDWTIWHPVNRGVLCASGPVWNRPLLYRMELVKNLQKLVGRTFDTKTLTNHLRTKYPISKDLGFRSAGKGYK